ncbi:MAG: nucleotidyltransferase family protein [Asticcacaulis sp.]
MKRDAVLTTLRSHEAELKRLGVGHLYLFGSVARDEATPESDVDLFFDYNNPKFSLFDLIGIKERVSDMLRTKADVMTRGSLHPVLKDDIEQSALCVF